MTQQSSIALTSTTVHPHFSIQGIAAFDDNYIWAIINNDTTECWVVDPGDATPVLDFLEKKSLALVGVLITHHHWDHTNGISQLAETFPELPVYGPNNDKIKGITSPLTVDGEQTLFPATGYNFALDITLFFIPGHTLDHLAYKIDDALFCGDTLFCGGCGRIFEGTPTQMYQSISTLAALPMSTKVYCAHEYTLSNLNFALTIEPSNSQLVELAATFAQKRTTGESTLPSTIRQEHLINPFLHCENESLRPILEQLSEQQCSDAISRFTILRQLKDKG